MKRFLLICIGLFLGFSAVAQIQPIDVTGPTYDTPNQAFTKVNANDAYLDAKVDTLDAEVIKVGTNNISGDLNVYSTTNAVNFGQSFASPLVNFGVSAQSVIIRSTAFDAFILGPNVVLQPSNSLKFNLPGTNTTGDIYQRDASGNFTRLPSVAAGNVLISGGAGSLNSWGKVTSAHIDGTVAPTLSPSLTGTPTAPTAVAGTNTTQIATTAFVKSQPATAFSMSSSRILGRTTSGTGATQEISIGDALTLSSGSLKWGGTLTGITNIGGAQNLNFGVPTRLAQVNVNTSGQQVFSVNDGAGFTANVNMKDGSNRILIQAAETSTGTSSISLSEGNISFSGSGGSAFKAFNVSGFDSYSIPVSTQVQAALDLKAPLASPALTGAPTAPTAAASTNTTQIATTAFVQQELSGVGGISNSAAANELMKSDGTNAVASGLFSTTAGNISLGTGLTGTARSIFADGSGSDVNLGFYGKGTGGLNFISGSGTITSMGLRSNGLQVGNTALGSSVDRTLHVELESAATNTVTNIARLTSLSSGTPAVGIGTGLEFETETAAGNNEITGAIESVVTNSASGNEYADLVLKNFSQGGQLEPLRLTATTGTSRLSTTYVNGFEFVDPVQISASTYIGGSMKVGIIGDKTIDRRLHVEDNTSVGNTVLYPLRLTSINNAGNGATGIGVGVEFESENGSGTNVVGSTIESVATDAANGSEDFDLVVKNMAAGAAATEQFRFSGKGNLIVPTTVTTGGTTGNQTINKISGTVNFAASATSLTVTNSLVTANSIVFAVVRSNDGTAVIKNVVPAAGSFTIRLSAAATAETSVGFFVVN